MKIAIVYDAVYPWIKGGGEKRIYELGKRLVLQGHEIHLFGIKWWNGPDIIEKDGMILHGVCGKMELYVKGRRSIYEAIVFSARLLPCLIEEKYDIIDICSFPYFSCFSAKFVSIFSETPMVITWHEVWGDYWYKYMGRYGFFGKTIEYVASKLGHKSIVVSRMTEKSLELLGVDRENIIIIPNGVDLKRIHGIEPSSVKCDIIFIGRLIKEKNVNVLIDAICLISKDFPYIKCHIIGNGPDKERLVGIIIKHGLLGKVRFFDSMEHDEIIARIKSSKMLVLPSSREGFGIVVMEALACGVPVITVNEEMNAASELVNEETGFVVDLRACQLSHHINILMNMTDDTREKMSKSAMEKASTYDWDGITEKLARFYREIVSTK